MMYFILTLAIVANASANFLLKLGMKKGGSKALKILREKGR